MEVLVGLEVGSQHALAPRYFLIVDNLQVAQHHGRAGLQMQRATTANN